MTPRKAKDLLGHYFGHNAVTVFDPLWPETMLGIAPGADRPEVIAALRARLTVLAEHPHDVDAHLLARVLRSVSAQMIEGPGADWTVELEAELDPAAAERRHDEVVARLPAEPVVSQTERLFRKQARAMVAASGATSRTVTQLYALAESEGLPPSVVDTFLSELVTPVEADEPTTLSAEAPTAPSHRVYDFAGQQERGSQRVWIAVGAVVTLAVVASSIFAIMAIVNRPPVPPGPSPDQSVQPAPVTQPGPVQQAPVPPPSAVRPGVPTADGPPDGRVFARSLLDALRAGAPTEQRDRAVLGGIDTLRRWWPRIDDGSRIAAVQAIAAGAVEMAQSESSRAALVSTLEAVPADPAQPNAVWHVSATAGLVAVLSRERELPPAVLQVCKQILAASTGDLPSAKRSGSTFDEAAVDSLLAAPVAMLSKPNQPSAATRAQADAWFTALRAATHVGSSADDASRRADVAVLDTVERLLTSEPDAWAGRSVFEFCSVLLAQARFREGDPGRDRVLSWFNDARLTSGAMHLITAAVATKSSAAGVESTMVLSPGATAAEREEMRVKYADAWSKAADAARATGPRGAGANADWYEAARAAAAQAGQATGDLEQLSAAATIAAINQAASLRSRGLPGAVVARVDPGYTSTTFKITSSAASDGEWARRFLAESRTASARLGRIAEFELAPSPGPVDCEVLAEAALLGTGETRAAAQKAALKRADDATMVNAVLETLPKAKRSANAGDFLGQFTLAGALPVSSDRWMLHFRRALVERLLTLLAAGNSTVAADRASSVLAEAWATVAGTPSGPVSEVDGPTESVNAAARAYSALLAQVRQQVPAPTALIHPDALDRSRAGRLLVAHGLPQAFAANQVSAVEALAVLVAAERPAAADQCRSLLATMNQERAVARSVAAQIRLTEETAMRLWALRLGEPL